MSFPGVLAAASSIEPVFFLLVVSLVVGLLVGATVARRDLWPFSHYPMFAGSLGGNAVRFFRLRLFLPDGRCVRFSGPLDALVDPFHRTCEQLWDRGPPPVGTLDAVALRTWREACRIDRTLVAAERVEIIMHVAQVVAGGKIVVAEKRVHVVMTGGRTVAR